MVIADKVITHLVITDMVTCAASRVSNALICHHSLNHH
jgi:hypothetical protein